MGYHTQSGLCVVFNPKDKTVDYLSIVYGNSLLKKLHATVSPCCSKPSTVCSNYLCADAWRLIKVKVQVFKVWYPVWRLYILPPGHWTCSFMCHFNSPGSIQSFSRFGALNLSYTLPSLSFQVLIFTWVKWSIWEWSVLPKDTPS